MQVELCIHTIEQGLQSTAFFWHLCLTQRQCICLRKGLQEEGILCHVVLKGLPAQARNVCMERNIGLTERARRAADCMLQGAGLPRHTWEEIRQRGF